MHAEPTRASVVHRPWRGTASATSARLSGRAPRSQTRCVRPRPCRASKAAVASRDGLQLRARRMMWCCVFRPPASAGATCTSTTGARAAGPAGLLGVRRGARRFTAAARTTASARTTAATCKRPRLPARPVCRYMPGMIKGDTLGHEFMGICEEVGPNVRRGCASRGQRGVLQAACRVCVRVGAP